MTKPKVLKLQIGCNPNSSSIGVMLFALPSVLFLAALAFNVSIFTFFVKRNKGKRSDKE
jgi:heme O synthase-like polyprenyltransferase